MANNLYKVNAGDVPMPSDVNQYSDALQGNADVGQLNLADNLAAPSSALNAAIAAGSGLSVGAYQYAYTYVTGYKKSNGSLVVNGETTLSPAASITTTSGNQVVNLTNIGTSSAPYVIARRIYRTKVGGSTFYLLAQLNDNVTTSYTDSTADTALSTTTAPTANTTGTAFSKINIGTVGNIGNMSVKYYGTHLHVENNAGYVFNDALWASYLNGNCYWDGSNWNRYDTTKPAAALVINYQQEPTFRSAGAGANPITWNQYRIFHEGNFTTRTHVLAYLGSAQQSLVANSWNRVKYDTTVYDYLGEFDTSNWWFVAANTGIYAISFGVRIINLQVDYHNIMLGTNQLNRSGNAYQVFEDHVNAATVQYFATQILYLSAGTQLEARVWFDTNNGGSPALATGQGNTWINISRIA